MVVAVENEILGHDRVGDARAHARGQEISGSLRPKVGETPAQARDRLPRLHGQLARIAKRVAKLAEKEDPHLASHSNL